MTHARAYCLLVLVTLLWAGNFPASKIGLAELGPLSLTGVRALLITPVLIVLARLAEGGIPTLHRRDWTAFVVLSLTGLVGNTTIWFWGMKYTNPINAGILGAAAPVVVAALAALWLRDRLSPRNHHGRGPCGLRGRAGAADATGRGVAAAGAGDLGRLGRCPLRGVPGDARAPLVLPGRSDRRGGPGGSLH